jgi:transposase-like protein
MGVRTAQQYDDSTPYIDPRPNARVARLGALLSRVLDCTGHEKELSHDIWWELVDVVSGAAREIDGCREVNITAGTRGVKPIWRKPGPSYFGDAEEPRLLINSIDRAVDLAERVLKGWRRQIESGGGPGTEKCFACVYSEAGAFSARSKTQSAALIAAILEAKIREAKIAIRQDTDIWRSGGNACSP